jgi:D-glycero-D-manno-heptose 1,7-bisphosphate phosphatase
VGIDSGRGAGLTVRAVFLDRDGVINESIIRDGKPYPPPTLEALRVCAGVPEALHALRGAGFKLIVVTNQPDVGAGRQRRELVDAIHAHLQRRLPLDDVRACFHTDADGCGCRKPKPGLLLQAAADWGIDLEQSFMVGDRWRDIDAGRAAGCRTILIPHPYAERAAEGYHASAVSLVAASRLILQNEV